MKTVMEPKSRASKSSGVEDSFDILQILHADHQKVAEMFFQYSQLEEDSDKEKEQLVGEIIKELYVHAKVEEELVYPAIRKADDESEDMMDEADTEHHVVKILLAELADMSATDDHYDSKVTVLCELVNHHVREEEKEIFEAFDEANINREALGQKVAKRKEELAKTPMPKGKAAVVTSSKSMAKSKK